MPNKTLGKPVKSWAQGFALRTLLVATAAGTLAGCTTTGRGNFCDLAAPIHPTAADADVISDQLVDGVLAHNETYDRTCRK